MMVLDRKTSTKMAVVVSATEFRKANRTMLTTEVETRAIKKMIRASPIPHGAFGKKISLGRLYATGGAAGGG